MSRDAVASVYSIMLTNDEFRSAVAEDDKVLDPWELSDEERQAVLAEAHAEVSGFSLGSGPAMSFLSGPSGPPLSPLVALSLGTALNQAAGLPTTSLTGHGIATSGGCCPWNKSFVAGGSSVE
jgi:hypothetical protein